MHFRCAIDKAGLTGIAVNPFQHRIAGIAAGTVDLNANIGGFVQSIGNMDFGHGNGFAGKVALIQQPCGPHHQETANLNIHGKAAQLHADGFAVRQADAEARALIGIVLRNFHAAF